MPDELHVQFRSPDFDASDLQVRRVRGREAISQPFSFDVELVSTHPESFDPGRMLGASASLIFEQGGVEGRAIHGFVWSVVDLLDTEPEHASCRVRIVPRMQRLALVETQEVFLGLSIIDIIKEKLALVNLGSTALELRLLETYAPRDVVVQYRETDLAFVSRLLEHAGVAYFFEHDDGADKIILTDQNGGFTRPGRLPIAHFQPRGERVDVYNLESEHHLFPASYAVLDYDYRAPHLELTSRYDHPGGYAGGVAEYGAHHRTPAEGDRLARVRAEEAEAKYRYFRGASGLSEFGAGVVVKLSGHPKLDDPKLLIVEVEHRLEQAAGTHGGDGKEGYTNTFRAVDASKSYRPPRVTPRPRIPGVLTAITEPPSKGASNRLAQIDDDGRYTVKFFFDLAGDARARSSAPVRMAQPHAGEAYGVHFPLKPGVEVTVTFVDGDPDRPIISGSVPNPVTPSPVTGRDATLNRIRTESGVLFQLKDG